MTEADPAAISVADLFTNLSSETDRLARIALCLDEALSKQTAVTDYGCAPSRELQSIDALRQSLLALSQITAAAASEVRTTESPSLTIASLATGISIERVRKACLRPVSTIQKCGIEPASVSCSAQTFFEEF
ncbi:hypothetical protein [Gymnodinialimonas ceratoperidinii]|uniref:Uncharacterized protein n=1 Tax=Gymnodinialimonas ceratoperidinii TaxID=2856823 RepID=A0A8F6U045_9RHOB|nr:hypothetical protein [Gymnodinialimonas ceratoperidinii]QXT41189.1 hypothetical protein KYE46_08265 [Gymnodinialimonas ceratoperidinii]